MDARRPTNLYTPHASEAMARPNTKFQAGLGYKSTIVTPMQQKQSCLAANGATHARLRTTRPHQRENV